MIRKRINFNYLNLTALICFSGIMQLSLTQDLAWDSIILTFILIAVLYLTEFILKKYFHEDSVLFNIVAIMLVIGWLILLRLQPQLAVKQLLWIILGCIIFLVLQKILNFIPNKIILKYKVIWFLVSFILLIIPLFIGIEVGGAKSWLELGFLRLQPSEAAKLSYLVFIASWLKGKNRGLQNLWPLWAVTLICLGLLVLQKDLGTGLVLYLVFIIIIYLATGNMKNSLIGIIFLGISGIIAYGYFPHVKVRFESWLNPWNEPERGGYQILQSLFAIANGGITGMGLGGGLPNSIPEAHTDFVFAVVGEQFGFLGATGVIILYLYFTFFGLKKAQLIPTTGSRLLAAGLTCLPVVQALIIIGGVTKLIPLTGLPLPFMSYGGSSTISNFAMLGILFWLGKEKSFVPAVTRKRLIGLNRLIFSLFLIVIINLVYLQVIKASSLQENSWNPRLRLVENVSERGSIFSSDGESLAFTDNDSKIRSYPLGEAAGQLIGYSNLRYGKSGLEASLNTYLLALPELKPGFIPTERKGWHVYTTINSQLQKKAWDLLQGKRGTCVVMDIEQGDILAMVSSPSFDPNTIEENWDKYQEDSTGIFLNRAVYGLYPPGSIFKIISGMMLLQNNKEIYNQKISLPRELSVDGYKFSDLTYRFSLNFTEALGFSSNLYFIKNFMDLDMTKVLTDFNNNFLKNDISSSALGTAAATLGDVENKVDFAAFVIGQGKLLVTPLHMAVWTAAIAGDGVMIKPRIIDKIVDFDNNLLEKFEPEVLGRVCSQEETEKILQSLSFAVNEGTGKNALVKGLQIGGKTGSAENNQGKPHAWFVGVAPLEKPRFVAVTIIENGERGGKIAAPIVGALLQEVYSLIP